MSKSICTGVCSSCNRDECINDVNKRKEEEEKKKKEQEEIKTEEQQELAL